MISLKKAVVNSAISCFVLACTGIASADETPAGAAADAINSGPISVPSSPSEQSGSASTTAAVDQSAAGTAISGLPEAGPGPLLEKRRALLNRIMAAKKQGIGTTAYMGEFNRIEDLVRNNQPESTYDSRLDSLSDGLDDQLKRSAVLKTQRPLMTAQPERRPASAPPMMRPAGGGGADSSGQMIDMLKSKYANRLGSGGLGALDKISPEQKDKLLHSDMAKELMKKYLGN